VRGRGAIHEGKKGSGAKIGEAWGQPRKQSTGVREGVYHMKERAVVKRIIKKNIPSLYGTFSIKFTPTRPPSWPKVFRSGDINGVEQDAEKENKGRGGVWDSFIKGQNLMSKTNAGSNGSV